MSEVTELRILLIEDNPGDARYIRELLKEAEDLPGRTLQRDGGLFEPQVDRAEAAAPDITHETRLKPGLQQLTDNRFDVVLLDLNLPDSEGIDTLSTLLEQNERIPVIVLTGIRDRGAGVEALRQGADEYLVKDEISPDLLVRSIYHAIERKAHQREQKRYETLIEESTETIAILDDNAQVKYVTPSVEHVLGYDPDELVGDVAFEYIHETDLTRTRDEFEALITDPNYRASVEFRFRHKDGSWTVLQAHGRNLLSEPDIDGIIVYTHDVTERKEYERRLERQRERLAALNQLNGVVHGVTEAVIERSTREEIEQIACEQLASSDSYDFAWIGEVNSTSRTVTSRAEAGVSDYLEDVTISTNPDTEAGAGPTGQAIQTGEMHTTHDVFDDDPKHEAFRDTADEYGFQSAAAIPISHEGTIYGVLNVYTARENAFQGEERIVIEHLGEIIGHAIAAAERKQALMSDAVIELELGIPDIFNQGEGAPLGDGTIDIQRLISVSDDEFLLYGATKIETIEAMEDMTAVVSHWEDVTTVGENTDRVHFELRVTEPPVLSLIASLGGSIENAVIEGGDYRLTVQFPQGTDVRQMVDAVKTEFPQADVLARRQVNRSESGAERITRAWTERLTDRQRTALEAAYYSGLFEWPRESSGEDVADSLGISAPTFHQHVRSAERKLFAALLEEWSAPTATTSE